MQCRKACVGVGAAAIMVALSALAGDKTRDDANTGSTTLQPPVLLDTKAMNAMLRADRDKDGMLSREELERYDMTLVPRFSEADTDRDGKLTLYEFESLLAVPQTAASSR